MKKASVTTSRESFDHKLLGYSTAAAVAVLLAPKAGAQIHNITTFSTDGGSNFSNTAPLVTLGNTVSFLAATAGHAIGFSGAIRLGGTGSGYLKGHIFAPTSHPAAAADFGISVAIPGGHPLASAAPHNYTFVPQVSAYLRPQFQTPTQTANAIRVGYVGFKTTQGGHHYYGWLRVKVTGGLTPSATITFEDNNGDGIFGAFSQGGIAAGQTASAIPEPAIVATGLALFALGAAGVREHRRRRKLLA